MNGEKIFLKIMIDLCIASVIVIVILMIYEFNPIQIVLLLTFILNTFSWIIRKKRNEEEQKNDSITN